MFLALLCQNKYLSLLPSHNGKLTLSNFFNLFFFVRGATRFMSCFLARIARKDIDWSLWAFQGSYMYRQCHEDPDECFGVMDHSWTKDSTPIT